MSTTPVSTRRHIPLAACFNLRDLGGYSGHGGRVVRWATVYRADGLHRLPAEECAELADLGIRMVVDLRTPAELETSPSFCHDGIEVLHLPVLRETWGPAGTTVGLDDDPVEFLGARYMEMAEEGASAIAATLELIASEARRPLVFHCAAGKDRTGITAAVLLGLLGVADDVILDDYELTSALYTPRRIAELAEDLRRHSVPEDRVRWLLEARRPVLAKALRHLHHRWGGFDNYAVDRLGLPDGHPDRLRSVLLIPDDEG